MEEFTMMSANPDHPIQPSVENAGFERFPPGLRCWLRRLTDEATEQAQVAWVFLRILGLIYWAAFASLGVQITGLIGQDGILPIRIYLASIRDQWGMAAYWKIPTLFWLNASDLALQLVCLAGMAAAVAVVFDVAVRRNLLICYGLYLSLTHAGQDFLSFQWDVLLLESGFLALLLPTPTRLVIGLFRFLLFRFMFMGGIVKLWSGEPTWRDMTALQFHLETQPIPSPLAWYAFQLPAFSLQVVTLLALVIELVIPMFMFLSRPYRLMAGACFLALQAGIMLTGNFAFFNVLTVALCLFALDDRDLRPLLGVGRGLRIASSVRPTTALARHASVAMAAVVALNCLGLVWLSSLRELPPPPLGAILQISSALNIVNGYGPFAVMNTERREIVIEGSRDGQNWMPYEFRYKPGDLSKPLGWNIPHQPRLDWQMWFAALGQPSRNAWFPQFLNRLRAGSRTVLALMDNDPFPDQPPAYLRARLYRYRFTTRLERSTHGQVWQRELLGDYDPLTVKGR